MTRPEGNPETQRPTRRRPDEVVCDAGRRHRRSSPVFDELTRQRTKEIIARYPQSRSALLPLLHLVQSVQGYVSQDGIRVLRRGSWS